MYVRGHSKETTEMTAALEGRILLWIGERKYPESDQREKETDWTHPGLSAREARWHKCMSTESHTSLLPEAKERTQSFWQTENRSSRGMLAFTNQQKSFYSPGGA